MGRDQGRGKMRGRRGDRGWGRGEFPNLPMMLATPCCLPNEVVVGGEDGPLLIHMVPR